VTKETENPAGREQSRSQQFARSRLFSVRLWKEQVADGAEYRGSVRDVTSGGFRSFREWSDLAAFMIERVDEDESGRSGQWETMP
jgi:hypothetical protein